MRPGNLGVKRIRTITTVLSIVVFIDGFMWIIGVMPTLYYAFTYQALPSLGGIRLLSGPFESLGINGLIVAGLIYVVISALKILAGYWLWNSRMDGVVLGLILLGLSTIFWYGFALPFGPLLGIPEFVLLLLAWKSLG
jgi:hypothetical protein